MTAWHTPEAYTSRTLVHAKVDAVIDEISAIQREQGFAQADAPSWECGWIITAFCVAVMGFAIGAQALWEMVG